MKEYQKPKLTKHNELKSITFSRENIEWSDGTKGSISPKELGTLKGKE